MPAQPSRRDVLCAAALSLVATALTSCTGTSVPDGPPPSPTPDAKARAAAALREESLAARASATATRHPGLTVAAQSARAHTAHAAALSETLPPRPSASGVAAAATPVPSSRSAAAKSLASAESAAADAYLVLLSSPGVTGDLARLLTSVAASDQAFADAVLAQGAA